MHSAWQMAKPSQTDKAAKLAYEKWTNHSWYLDPTVVPFVLANNSLALDSAEMEAIAKTLYDLEMPVEYDFDRKNNTGILPEIDCMLEHQCPPSLAGYITKESWLVFQILGQNKTQCKWMLYPASSWHIDADYLKFQQFVKSLAVVNDASERAVKLVQETVNKAMSEKKLQKMLLVKSKLAKPKNRTKKAYREAAEQLTPSEQLEILFRLPEEEETEISSCSEMNSSLEIINDEDVEAALVAENDD